MGDGCWAVLFLLETWARPSHELKFKQAEGAPAPGALGPRRQARRVGQRGSVHGLYAPRALGGGLPDLAARPSELGLILCRGRGEVLLNACPALSRLTAEMGEQPRPRVELGAAGSRPARTQQSIPGRRPPSPGACLRRRPLPSQRGRWERQPAAGLARLSILWQDSPASAALRRARSRRRGARRPWRPRRAPPSWRRAGAGCC